jgi:hypothetical protein
MDAREQAIFDHFEQLRREEIPVVVHAAHNSGNLRAKQVGWVWKVHDTSKPDAKDNVVRRSCEEPAVIIQFPDGVTQFFWASEVRRANLRNPLVRVPRYHTEHSGFQQYSADDRLAVDREVPKKASRRRKK